MRVNEGEVLDSAAAKGGSGGQRNGALPKEATHPVSRSSAKVDRLHYPGSDGFIATLLPRNYDKQSFRTATHNDNSNSCLLVLILCEPNNLIVRTSTRFTFGSKEHMIVLDPEDPNHLPIWTTKLTPDKAQQQYKNRCEPRTRINFLNENTINNEHIHNRQSNLQQTKNSSTIQSTQLQCIQINTIFNFML
jgi:hypothetical protein